MDKTQKLHRELPRALEVPRRWGFEELEALMEMGYWFY